MKKGISLLIFGLFLMLPLLVAAEGSMFSVSPSRGTSSWLMYEIKPGDNMNDAVVITNSGTEEITLQLYPIDEEKIDNASKDAFALSSLDKEQKTIGKWIKLGESEVTLKAGEKKNVSFTLSLPADVQKEVTYAGGIVATPVVKSETDASGKKNQQVVNITTRSGLRVYLKATDSPKLTATTQPAEDKTTSNAGATTTGSSYMNIIFIVIGALVVIVIAVLIFRKKKS